MPLSGELLDKIKNCSNGYLNLSAAHIDPTETKDLVEKLRGSSVTHLDLASAFMRKNQIKDLAEGLKGTNVTHLNLQDNFLYADELITLIKALKDTKVKSINLSLNLMRSVLNSKNLAESLKDNTNLTSINLSGNRLNAADAKNIVEGLKDTNVTSINLDKNYQNPKPAKNLNKILKIFSVFFTGVLSSVLLSKVQRLLINKILNSSNENKFTGIIDGFIYGYSSSLIHRIITGRGQANRALNLISNWIFTEKPDLSTDPGLATDLVGIVKNTQITEIVGVISPALTEVLKENLMRKKAPLDPRKLAIAPKTQNSFLSSFSWLRASCPPVSSWIKPSQRVFTTQAARGIREVIYSKDDVAQGGMGAVTADGSMVARDDDLLNLSAVYHGMRSCCMLAPEYSNKSSRMLDMVQVDGSPFGIMRCILSDNRVIYRKDDVDALFKAKLLSAIGTGDSVSYYFTDSFGEISGQFVTRNNTICGVKRAPDSSIMYDIDYAKGNISFPGWKYIIPSSYLAGWALGYSNENIKHYVTTVYPKMDKDAYDDYKPLWDRVLSSEAIKREAGRLSQEVDQVLAAPSPPDTRRIYRI